MQARVKFTVPGKPIAQPRQRHRVVKAGPATYVQNYTPAKSAISEYKASVKAAAIEVQEKPLNGPLGVHLVCVFKRPSNVVWKTKPMTRLHHSKKPDLDNIAKAVLDSLNGIIYYDDAQVVRLVVEKWIAAGDELPHTEVAIYQMDAQDASTDAA